jgi:hypothetical protein
MMHLYGMPLNVEHNKMGRRLSFACSSSDMDATTGDYIDVEERRQTLEISCAPTGTLYATTSSIIIDIPVLLMPCHGGTVSSASLGAKNVALWCGFV